ncbi:MAG: peptidylprolyl isomerase [Dehalococcoidia bacterium]|nr:peptidylprolyl isomerase [Dehalococcoidia bacterium]
MAKKQKKATPQRAPTKRQLSKWQRQMKIRRIVIIAAAVFLAGIISWVAHGYYTDRIQPWREVVLEVNNARFNMGYYVKMLDAYTQDMEPMMVYYMGGMVADNIIEAELMRQGAGDLNIEVTRAEIGERMEEWRLPDNEVYRDIIRAVLLQEKLSDHFESGLPETMEQAHIEVMLVESEEVANQVLGAVAANGNFTALVDEFSRYPAVEGDLGWLPQELMPEPLISEAAFDADIDPGQISLPIYDETVTKSIGYWLIEVLDERDEEDEEEEPERSILARAILVGSKDEAEQVRAELVVGNFTDLAKEYSHHQSKEFGGALGWIEPGQMQSTAFDAVAFALAPGELSQPVRDESMWTPGGYWLVHVVDRGEQELDEEARQQLVDLRFQNWLEVQREKSRIEDRLDEEKIWLAVEEVLRRR